MRTSTLSPLWSEILFRWQETDSQWIFLHPEDLSFFPGISRVESSEEELDEITVDEEGEDEKGGKSLAFADTSFQYPMCFGISAKSKGIMHHALLVQKTFCSGSSASSSCSGPLSCICWTTWPTASTNFARTTWTSPRCCASSERCSTSSRRRWVKPSLLMTPTWCCPSL